MKNIPEFISRHAAFASIIVVCAMGVNSVFVDKDNAWDHWSWLFQMAFILSYLAIEYLRYKKVSLSVEERFKKYLLDFENWESVEEDHWHYRPDPNFVVCPREEDIWEVEGGENWVRAAINPKAWVKPMQLMYSQTIITKINCIYFDEMRYLIPAPKVTGMIGHGEKWFYSICADDFDFYLMPLLVKKDKQEILQTESLEAGRGASVPVAIFSSTQEKSRFEVFLSQKPIKDSELSKFIINQNDPLIKDIDRKIISYSKAVLERLKEYRQLEA